jgi:hypothetical protein
MLAIGLRKEQKSYQKVTQARWMRRRGECGERLLRSLDTTNARWRVAINPMGRGDYIHSSEGSLNQHLKIKHPEIFKTLAASVMGGNQPVKESDEED